LKKRIIESLFFVFLVIIFAFPLSGQEAHDTAVVTGDGETKKKFDASTFIMDHVADSHEWHILTKKDNSTIAIYLPVILYSREKGLDIFSSKKLAHGHEYKGYRLEEEGDLKGRIVSVDETGVINEEHLPLDFSMTKAVVGMLFAAIVGLWLFLTLARSYKKTGISHPKGIQSFLEPVVLFIRDDIAVPNLGHKSEKYLPYLCLELKQIMFHQKPS